MNKKLYLVQDEKHGRECHQRWLLKVNRDINASDYRPEWGTQQCGGCRYFVPLVGYLTDDWGGCTNSASLFDKQIMYEHDGCDAFDPASNGWFAGTYFEDQRLEVDEEGNLINPQTGEKVDLASLE
jgi:hypothetical protein